MRKSIQKYILVLFPLFSKEIIIGLSCIALIGIYQMFALNHSERVFGFKRPDYMEGSKTESVFFRMQDNEGSDIEVKLPISEVESNTNDRIEYLKTLNIELKDYIGKQNNKFSSIEYPLVLPETYKKCRVIYTIEPINRIDEEGWFLMTHWNKSEQITIEYKLLLEEETLEDHLNLVIAKDAFTQTYIETYYKHTIEALWRINDQNKSEREVLLPSEYKFYSTPKSFSVVQFCIALVVLVFMCSILSRTELKLQESNKKRFKRIHLTYFINNFILFFQTGLTIQKSYILSLQNRLSSVDNKSELYDHLKKLEVLAERDNELQISLENFLILFPYAEGRRFTRLIIQNIKQGDHLLIQQLQQLATSMWEERIRLARKESEKASSKLIFPMLLIFVVILIITIVPTLIEVKNFL